MKHWTDERIETFEAIIEDYRRLVDVVGEADAAFMRELLRDLDGAVPDGRAEKQPLRSGGDISYPCMRERIRDLGLDKLSTICVPCNNCGYVEGRPVKDCGHVGTDGCCEHPDNMTPECHHDACPLIGKP